MLSLSVVYSCLVGVWLLSKPIGPYKGITKNEIINLERDQE